MSSVDGLNPPTPYTGTDTTKVEINFLETYVDQLLGEIMPGGALAGSSPFMPGDSIGTGSNSYQGGGEVGQVLQLVQQLLQQIAVYEAAAGEPQWSPFSSQGGGPSNNVQQPLNHKVPATTLSGSASTTIVPASGSAYVGTGGDIASSGPLKGLPYGAEIASAAAMYGLDPTMLYGQAMLESGGNGTGGLTVGDPNTPGGGMFQVTPGYQTPKGETPSQWNTGNPAFDQALDTAEIDSMLIKEAGGNVSQAIDAYNSGNFNTPWNPAAQPASEYPSYYADVMTMAARVKAYEQSIGNG